MNRLPTPKAVLYAWHANALRGAFAEAMPVEEMPQCGFFRRCLVRGGPPVPARIWMDQPIDDISGELEADESLRCEVNGRRADAEEQWEWLRQDPISEADFKFLSASVAWATENAPNEPMARPRHAVDWSAIPTPVF